jgi:hypothetical protein
LKERNLHEKPFLAGWVYVWVELHSCSETRR